MVNRRVGIRSIIPIPDSPEEIKSDELEEFYKKDIEGKTYAPQSSPEINTLDLPSIDLVPLKKSSETRDIHGNTKAQKNRAIYKHLTRPPVTDQDIQDRDFWKAYNSPNSKDMLSYVNKYGGVEQDNTVKQLTALKEYGRNPYTYKSKIDTLVEKSQHPADKYYEDRIDEIQKKGKSWAVKHFNKQDQQKEVQRLKGIVERNAKLRKTDQYGNLPRATDRIQEQDRKKAEIEIRNKSKTNKEIKNV